MYNSGLLIRQLRSEGDAGFLHGAHLLFPKLFLFTQSAPLGDLIPLLSDLIEGFLGRHRIVPLFPGLQWGQVVAIRRKLFLILRPFKGDLVVEHYPAAMPAL